MCCNAETFRYHMIHCIDFGEIPPGVEITKGKGALLTDQFSKYEVMRNKTVSLLALVWFRLLIIFRVSHNTVGRIRIGHSTFLDVNPCSAGIDVIKVLVSIVPASTLLMVIGCCVLSGYNSKPK